MRPVFQTITHMDPENGVWGDCLRACVASLFEYDIAHVPNFVDEFLYPEGFYPALQEWLRPRDLCYMASHFPFGELAETGDAMRRFGIDGYHLLGGRCGLHNHVVVAQHCLIIHDPNPKLDSPFRNHLSPDDNGNFELGLFAKLFKA